MATTLQRPSVQALNGFGNDFSDANDYYNGRDPGLTFEQRREAGLLDDWDKQGDAGIATDRARNDKNFYEGSGQMAADAQTSGDIARTQATEDAQAGARRYFDPDVQRMERDKEADALATLHARYSDPAIIKGQADLAAATTRGIYGDNRESIKQLGQYQTAGEQGQTALGVAGTNANARLGAAAATSNPNANLDPFRPGYQPPPGARMPARPDAIGGGDPSKTISMDDFMKFTQDRFNGDVQGAKAAADQLGWSIVR